MSYVINVSGLVRNKRKKIDIPVSRELIIDSSGINDREAYEIALSRIIDNNVLGLSSGTHIYKGMVLTVVRI